MPGSNSLTQLPLSFQDSPGVLPLAADPFLHPGDCPNYYTLAQLAAIEKAIASGVTSVSYEGKSVSYRSLQEMRLILAEIKRALGCIPRQRRFTPVTFKHF